MNIVQKFLFFSLLGVIFFTSFFFKTYALLGEDLGLDLYKQIDEGFYELERKQYEYELTGQGEASINEVIRPILARRGIECEINSSQEINNIVTGGSENKIQDILERCGYSDESPAPIRLAEEVTDTLNYVQNTFSSIAQNKSEATYEIARIGLYNDGDLENSPFDLIHDLQEIDRIIFTQEIPYEGIEAEKSSEDALDDFLTEDKKYLYENKQEDEDINDEDDESNIGTLIDNELKDEIEGLMDVAHSYKCTPSGLSGLNAELEQEIEDYLSGSGSGFTPVVTRWAYPDEFGDDGIWDGPFPGGAGLSGTYDTVKDSWGCDPSSFFCIIISFENAEYGLTGGETMSIEKILARAAEHLEKPANASLTQRKMTTNNFEIGSIIENLPDMLRGFGIEVQTKPIPILELENENEDMVRGETSLAEEKLRSYYRDIGMDYDRRNDLSILRGVSGNGASELEQKIIQTADTMPITYIENRRNELARFNRALTEYNRIESQATDQEIVYDDMRKFADQFAELERFVISMEDFVRGLTGHIERLREIPTRSS